MLKKTIKFNDYNGVEREEDFYFNLSEAEVMEMEMSHNGGITTMIQRIVKEKDQEKIVEIFKDLILRAHGRKSDDGRKFIKNQEIRDDFLHTEAYSKLFMELASSDKAAADFVNGIVPKPKKQPNTNPNAK
jgi:hypothetical protein